MFKRYARWLHTGWPAGRVEKLPEVRPDGSTAVPGLWIAGDLAGVPLLKFALDSGARVARRVADDVRAHPSAAGGTDLAIVGAGVAGMAAALEAKRLGLAFVVIEAAEPFATIADFPAGKPIFTYPGTFTPEGPLQVTAPTRETLLEELRAQAIAAAIPVRPGRAERVTREGGALALRLAGGEVVRARHVLLAIGRTGEARRLGVPGEAAPRAYHRLHDPAAFANRDVLVAGGGDSACEAAIALAGAGARVTLVHRGPRLDRPRPENAAAVVALERAGRLTRVAGATLRAIGARDVTLSDGRTLANDVVFALLGREAPLELLRASGVPIAGELRPRDRIALAAFVALIAVLDDWKAGGPLAGLAQRLGLFPFDLPHRLATAGGALATAAADPRTLLGTLAISAAAPAFWFTLAYSAVVVTFGIARIRRRRTPYVTLQTTVLAAVQVLPLFLLPEVLLPWLDHNGLLPRAFADALFPAVTYGHGREFWRAYGFVFAFPLDVYNVFTPHPLPWWLVIGALQVFVLIPLAVWRWGKGAYCGWICSCGALAETLGDTARTRMPHGPRWNRLNMAGQVILGLSLLLLAVRVAGWMLPPGNLADRWMSGPLLAGWKWIVDIAIGSVIGVGLYFWYSGRVWCRFFCPLAAWMHVLARFSRFAIVPEKAKCISCNQCTAQCHMGIDVMAFAQRGAPMRDPECVRCSACVGACPTGVLQFGSVAANGAIVSLDSLLASPVRARENAQPVA